MNFIKPKYHADFNLQQKQDYYEYENFDYQVGDLNNYEILNKIGRGKYSEVFEGVNIQQKNYEKVVIKILKPVRVKKIKREIKILQLLNHKNIICLKDVVKDQTTKTTSLIFESIQNQEYKSLYQNIKENELKFIMFEVMSGLNYAHSQGIIHRDIKPQNIMVNLQEKKVKIIDWGLAEFYFPGKEYNVRVSTRYFKAPELLVDYNYYDYQLDIWSLGCMFAGIIFQKEPFFMGQDNQDQLSKILKVLGTQNLLEYLDKFEVKLDQSFENILQQEQKKIHLKTFVNNKNQHLATANAIDLLNKMLQIDHTQRITAQDALLHPYFNGLKNE